MIQHFIGSMVMYCIVATPIYGVLRFLYIRRKNFSVWREIVLYVFVLYTVAILSQTIIPNYRAALGYRTMNLVPFQTISSYGHQLFSGTYMNRIAFYNLTGNILLFIPFGMLLPLLWRPFRKIGWQITAAIVIPLFIEGTQYFIGRSTDIDDVILNAVSIYLGFVMTQWLLKRFWTE
ncbi:VanZ family protein [Lysinibacillus sp. LZ02]|uniref:VanZ family protein n=1 Tax=Lysinibacillus sp. LZ02 TaxID=3420668 RepID=UPI003D35FE5C